VSAPDPVWTFWGKSLAHARILTSHHPAHRVVPRPTTLSQHLILADPK